MQRKTYYQTVLFVGVILVASIGVTLGIFYQNMEMKTFLPIVESEGDLRHFLVACGLWGGGHFYLFTGLLWMWMLQREASDIYRWAWSIPLFYTLFSCLFALTYMFVSEVPKIPYKGLFMLLLGRLIPFYLYIFLAVKLEKLLMRYGLVRG